MTVDEAFADVHRHFCSTDGAAHDDACVALRRAESDHETEVSLAYGHGYSAGRASLEPIVGAVREFAEGIVAYEDEHAAGPDTPLRLAFARDLLAILEESR